VPGVPFTSKLPLAQLVPPSALCLRTLNAVVSIAVLAEPLLMKGSSGFVDGSSRGFFVWVLIPLGRHMASLLDFRDTSMSRGHRRSR
jgi:hypothetical protein